MDSRNHRFGEVTTVQSVRDRIKPQLQAGWLFAIGRLE
jgi:hypothetical protein